MILIRLLESSIATNQEVVVKGPDKAPEAPVIDPEQEVNN